MCKNQTSLSLPLFILVLIPICAHAGTITSSLGFENFPEGVTLLPNRFTLENSPSGVFSVSFYIDDYDGLPLQIDNKGSDGWSKEFDMGSVRPGARLHVVALSLTGDTLDSQVVPLGIIPAPHWLKGAKISDVSVSGSTVSFTALSPIDALFQDAPPTDIPGMGGRQLAMLDAGLELPIRFDLSDRSSEILSAAFVVRLNAFNQKAAEEIIPIPTFEAELDRDLNLRFVAETERTRRLFSLDFPGMTYPIGGIASIRIDVGCELHGRIHARVVVGPDDASGQWGFVRSDDKVTGFGADLLGIGWIQGSFDVLFGLFRATGALELLARLGAGVVYESVPEEKVETPFGGSIALRGRIKFKAFWFLTIAEIGPKVIFRKDFGDPPIALDDKERRTAGAPADERLRLPDQAPESIVVSVEGRPVTAWIVRRPDEAEIRLSIFAENRFADPIVVRAVRGTITGTTLLPLTDGTIGVVWNESDVTSESAGEEFDLIALLHRQQIMMSIVDPLSGDAGAPVRVSGEGHGTMPTATVVDPDHVLIAWTALSSDTTGSEIHTRTISISDMTLSDAIDSVPVPPGANSAPRLATAGDGSPAIVWRYRDSATSYLLRSHRSGDGWGLPVTTWASEAEIVDAVIDQINGAPTVALSTDRVDPNGDIIAGMHIVAIDGSNPSDTTMVLQLESDTTRYTNLAIATDGADRSTVAWTAMPIASDSTTVVRGTRGLVLLDYSGAAMTWSRPGVASLLSDSSSVVWDASAAFGSEGIYYQISQETGGGRQAGVSFASNALDLVLRAVRFDESGNVFDAEEPERPTSGVMEEELGEGVELDLSGM